MTFLYFTSSFIKEGHFERYIYRNEIKTIKGIR